MAARRLAQTTIFGNLTGLLVHGVALAAGLSVLLVASATACTVVKLAGAAYLVYLGVQALRASRLPPTEAPSTAIAAPRRAFLQGLISTVFNDHRRGAHRFRATGRSRAALSTT